MSTTARPKLQTYSYPVPLPKEILDLQVSMPKFQGKIQNPLYVPRQHQARQLLAWRAWCKEHRHVPPFLKDPRVKQLAHELLGSEADPRQVERDGGSEGPGP